MAEEPTTHFGYQQVPVGEKAARVGQVFRSVAGKYDLMNDLMSLGLHRLWKDQAIRQLNLRPGMRVLDLASGTGDLAEKMLRRVGEGGQVVMSDINEAMLDQGRRRMIDRGRVGNVEYVLANAEDLPLPSAHFDRVTIGFGLRNVTDKLKALKEMRRVLKPGGMALVLEFSQLYAKPLQPVYDLYSFQILPRLGQLIASDAESYRYLAESIRMHPDQESLKQMMVEAGFEDCDYTNMSGGIVACHRGYTY
ncbi:bifunctional demethylmenaquinone methyltransferase/2-methoxy-6-polyprenyl-1,4-benzoquinol methylase UbiE [Alkalilimnicola sp. S0819]|uniref:bifunctional demethylmenaquinone methyltransferase/2-methoxy-6-polyprenyl-1,4-benzoquinol methylase UbiE n=1 Tax=Alkalilimnicola sp. S0819 TaxID=2613922 RepID=UPI001261DFD1|nr:bifunctional demethylmenaquinone methyltransferase/2-methoxy-6-polyprenyl-1,4-benzoquinol methylase UbiE [Alkalilimnicola sp. S0819]KAB7622717.1 bifunctional demethylmenaquinone methyltransferase/2-methoxy-6-polyprenyl-1,4-benzoquinol methylase UbiE [Alkalilimnicola sp. S0819]MPQ17357.1 bifunctional demethylmenaquinone methyltransferase/2-methoxy-6-polyprenyl-1,4-benzoquinol methylase UbiE [Alkalilimnicola sp. S0819]